MKSNSGQGALEYLLLIGGALIVAGVVVVTLLSVSTNSTSPSYSGVYQVQMKQLVAAKSLSGYWKLDEGSGVTAIDSSGSGNSGTITGSPPATTGKFSGSYSFDGATDYVTVPYSARLAPTTGLTVSAWFKMTDKTQLTQRIISKTENGGYYIALNDGGGCASSICVLMYIGGAYQPAMLYSLTNLENGKWYHIAITYNGSLMAMYINGALVTSQAASGNIGYNNNNPFCIGAEAGSSSCGSSNFNGSIDEVIVVDRGLSAPEVKVWANG